MAENTGEVISRPEFEVSKEPIEGQEVLREKAIEQRPQTEAAKTRQTPQFVPPDTQGLSVQGISSPAPTSTSSQKSLTPDLTAQDSDLIEKQWVIRAKSIVSQTQDDPFTQKKQMSRIKADYIKKRFDKTIPADDAVAT